MTDTNFNTENAESETWAERVRLETRAGRERILQEMQQRKEARDAVLASFKLHGDHERLRQEYLAIVPPLESDEEREQRKQEESKAAAIEGISLDEYRARALERARYSLEYGDKIDDMANNLKEWRELLEKCGEYISPYGKDLRPRVYLDDLKFLARKIGRLDIYDAIEKEVEDFEDGENLDMNDEESEAYGDAELKLSNKLQRVKQAFNMQLLRINKQKHLVKMFVACVAVHSIAMYRHARARSYRAPARNTSNSNAAHDDGGGGDGGGESDSSDPPARRYNPSVVLSKFKFNIYPVAVDNPRLLLRGLRKEAAA